MKKIGKGFIVALLIIFAIGLDFLIVSGLYGAICWCFDFHFKWVYALGIWLIMFAIKFKFKRKE